MPLKTVPQPEPKSAVLQEFELILKKATEKKASDVHFKAGLPAIVRVNGNLYYLAGDEAGENVPRLDVQQLRNFSEALMTVRQKEKYEAGEEVDLGYDLSGRGRFRINLCQQRGNPRMVCRHIPDHIRNFDELHLPPVVQELTQFNRGLILVTGATGSGKSTTLAAMIDHIAQTKSCHIVTIEDPIEYTFESKNSVINQREVEIDTKSFHAALRSAFREDIDVIMVGEMRGPETMSAAVTAAETGHLVLSTLHTNNAAQTIDRIIDTFPAGQQDQIRIQLASSLAGIFSQRLVPRISGGLIPAYELLVNNEAVANLIRERRTHEVNAVIETGTESGMIDMNRCLADLVRKGEVTPENALARALNPKTFTRLI